VLRCLPDVKLEELEIDTLRLHISAESNLASTLYEVLCNNCTQIQLRDATPGSKKEPIVLPRSALRPVGFEEDEGMLPYPRRSFLGYRLLQEYFTFPDKFFFLDLDGLAKLRTAGFGDAVEIVFLTSPFELNERKATLETGVSAETIRLGCTPIINLFEKTSEPIQLTHRQQDYMLVADARRRSAVGIFSVDDVVAIAPGATEPAHFHPFYSFRHGSNIDDRLFWTATRRPATWRADEGTDVFLSFVDGNARTMQPTVEAVTARLHCFDGNLPSRLPFGDPNGDFEMPGGGPIEKIITLVKPTPVIDPPLGKPQLWRLISQLSLNYVSLTEGGVDTLRELLRLHNFGETTSGERQIQGLVSVEGKPVFSRIENRHGLTFARGQRVEIEFDEEKFAGGGVYLFASVLERFLGLYVSLNSFCIRAARTRQRRELMREWPPRAGWKALL
jgi:type VI secretion system protein ImpG